MGLKSIDYQITTISVSQITSRDIDVAKYCLISTKDRVGPLRDLVCSSPSHPSKIPPFSRYNPHILPFYLEHVTLVWGFNLGVWNLGVIFELRGMVRSDLLMYM